MRALILAAGRGERLLPLTKNYPKPLTPILGKPLLEHIVETLKDAMVKDIVIVTGYLNHFIQEYFGDGSKFQVKIRYIYNPVYKNGNGSSLKVAQELLAEDEAFLLLMSDHLIDVNIVNKALRNVDHKPLLCVDRQPHDSHQIKDATKVLVNSEGYIINIGKDIAHWNGVDTGVFLLDNNIFEEMVEVEKLSHFVSISDCIKGMITNGKPLWACDVSRLFWLDIDTIDDLERAKLILRGER
ncbi:MAG: phosphocholine cytidylyltransferase family protein [Candidatus Hodarchaeales archaeon]